MRLHDDRGIDHVARQFDVDRLLVLDGGAQHAIDLARGRLRVIQHRGGDGQLLEHLELRVEIAHLVMEQRVAQALVHARRAADDDHRRLLGVGLGGGIGDLQPADAIGDADDAQTVEPRVGVGGKARALLVAGVDDLQVAVLQRLVEAEDVIAGHAEDVARAEGLEAVDEVGGDGGGWGHGGSPGKGLWSLGRMIADST